MKRHSIELKKKRFEKKVKRFIFLYFFPAFISLILLIFLFNSDFLSIKKINIKIDNNKYLDKEEILWNIENIFNEKYWGIFSKRNYVFYPSQELKERILEKYIEIEDMDLNWGTFLEDIDVTIKEEQSEYLYCTNIQKKKCYDVSKDGKIFYKSKWKEKENKLILISQEKLNQGDIFFSSLIEKEKIISIINFIEKTKKIKIKYFIKKNKYFYILKLEDGIKILLNSDFAKEDIILKINKILNQKDFKWKEIRYIDLSLKSRLSYCMKGDICEKNFKEF